MALILYAEDDPDQYDFLIPGLEMKFPGVPIIHVQNGELFLQEARTGNYAAAITDNQMPKKTGLEAIGELRQEFNKMPICLVSSDDDPDLEKRARAAGADHFVPKKCFEEMIPALIEYLMPYLRTQT